MLVGDCTTSAMRDFRLAKSCPQCHVTLLKRLVIVGQAFYRLIGCPIHDRGYAWDTDVKR
jgi:hypothetical protein